MHQLVYLGLASMVIFLHSNSAKTRRTEIKHTKSAALKTENLKMFVSARSRSNTKSFKTHGSVMWMSKEDKTKSNSPESLSEINHKSLKESTLQHLDEKRLLFSHRQSKQNIGFQTLKIAAFNVQTFGLKKMTDSMIRDIVVKIVLRYDVILIQEIRDSIGNAIKDLMKLVNRNALLSPKKFYVYDDGDERHKNDTFEREPFIVHFQALTAALQDVVLVAIHTSPSRAVQEVDQLAVVYDDIVQRWKIDDVIIMGDLNIACNYVKDKDWLKIRLAVDKRFDWLITDCVDTTVGGGSCAYDRFVVAGRQLKKAIVPQSAGRFKFDDLYGLDQIQTAAVSDHYPIEMELYSKEWRNASNVVKEFEEFTFKSSQSPTLKPHNIWKLRSKAKNPLLQSGFKTKSLYSSTRKTLMVIVEKTVTSVSGALAELSAIHHHLLSFVSTEQISMAVTKLKQVLNDGNPPKITVRLVCGVTSTWRCWVAFSIAIG